MTYTVKYRRKGQWFWRAVKEVKADLVATDIPGNPRILILADETRVEIPTEGGLEIQFSSQRFLVIKQNMERSAGQPLSVT